MSPLISGLASVASLIFNASGGSGKAPVAVRRPSDTEAGPASVVQLSPQAQALAGVAGRAASHGAPAISSATSGMTTTSAKGGSVSTEDFQALLSQFGATDAQKDQLSAGLDTDKDGAISRGEFLRGLADTQGGKSTSIVSQAVLQVMDGAGQRDGTVTPKEFAALTTAFAALEKSGVKTA